MARSLERLPVSEDGYTFPATEILTGRGFITGKSGSGKSNTASVVAEELLERGLGLLIVDTDGEYQALKERYDVLHVGADDDCDRVVGTDDAGQLADLALGENVPIVLDVSGFADEGHAREVILEVVTALFVAESDYSKPFLLFLEEAHEFIPQQGGGTDLSKMLIRVAKRGRKRGLGICAMSQRPAAVDKDYITQCDWLVWHRLTWESDTAVAGRILGGDSDETVQSLDDGEALVLTDWDEQLVRIQFRRKRTVDAGSTPDVEDAYGPRATREDHVVSTPDADDEESTTAIVEEDEQEPPVDLEGEFAELGPADEDEAPVEEGPTEEDSIPDRRRRRALESQEEADPLWELGHLLVYCYDSIVLGNRRFVGGIQRGVLAAIRVVQRSGGAEPSQRVRRLARITALATVGGLYGSILIAMVLMLAG